MFAFMESIERPTLPAGAKSFRKIDEMFFIEDIDAFVAQPQYANDTESALRALSASYTEYGDTALVLESSYVETQAKVETLKNTLKMLKSLREQREEFTTRFMLLENVYLDAVVPPVDKVIVVLGADIMIEYNLDEAENYIKQSITQSVKDTMMLEHDLDYIKDQLTTTESNISRVYNNGLDKMMRDQVASEAARRPSGSGQA